MAGEDIPTYAEQMFEAGGDLTGKTAEEVFLSDFKVFSRGDAKFGVGQSSYMTEKSRSRRRGAGGTLPAGGPPPTRACRWYSTCSPMCSGRVPSLMYTGHNAERILRAAFQVEPQDGKAVLEGVVSRKKQLIPPLMAAMQDLEH